MGVIGLRALNVNILADKCWGLTLGEMGVKVGFVCVCGCQFGLPQGSDGFFLASNNIALRF